MTLPSSNVLHSHSPHLLTTQRIYPAAHTQQLYNTFILIFLWVSPQIASDAFLMWLLHILLMMYVGGTQNSIHDSQTALRACLFQLNIATPRGVVT